ncbi:MAG: hypothetical protein ABSF48_09905 [Thermodesulfobacteriota bacterium]
MKTISHTDEAAKKIVKKFCEQVFWLRNVRHIYEELFENEQSPILMKRTAPSFFADLNTILHSYLLLEFAKITDPAETREKENFTVDNLIVSIDWPQDIRDKLTSLSEKTKGFRRHILGARHKLLAHTDKEAFLADRTLGGFPEGEDEIFLKTLQEVCDITHEACFGSIFGQMILTMPGDVINFKRALENAVAFNELLSESSGQEKTRLYSYLQKARHRPTSTQGEVQKEDS